MIEREYNYLYNPITGKRTNTLVCWPGDDKFCDKFQEHNVQEFLMCQLADSFVRADKGPDWRRVGIREVNGVPYIVQVRWVELRKTCDGHYLHTTQEECDKYDNERFYEDNARCDLDDFLKKTEIEPPNDFTIKEN